MHHPCPRHEFHRKRSTSLPEIRPKFNRNFRPISTRGSLADEVRYLKSRASELIIHVPVENLKKIANTSGVNSLSKETQYFCGICTMHGPLRVYRGKSYSRLFWSTMMTFSAILLIWQNCTLIKMYFSKPTASSVFFIIPEDGIDFPTVTICSYNSVRRSYIEKLNETGLFAQGLLDYIKQSYVEVSTFYAYANAEELKKGQELYDNFTMLRGNQNFTYDLFYFNAGFDCNSILRLCTFGGRNFSCCDVAQPILTDLGKCFTMKFSEANDPFLRKQTQSGINSGLRIVADFHNEELLEGYTGDEPQPFLSNGFENGFRYFLHANDEISYLSHEGISVSPGSNVDSSVGPTKFLLLDQSEWGNCTGDWPHGYHSNRSYSSSKCKALCTARWFYGKCKCSPFYYNIDNEYPVCSPLETYDCLYRITNASKTFIPPKCMECKMECERWSYHTYNSYTQGFSNDALSWLHRHNNHWTVSHIRTNFVTINIAYSDMSYTVYSQVQSTSLTTVLSNIGGNMGLFLGISVISCAEIIMYVAKMTWTMISKKRRDHLLRKKAEEAEREQRLRETIEAAHRPKETEPLVRKLTLNGFMRFGSQLARKAWKGSSSNSTQTDALNDGRRRTRAAFIENFVENRLYNHGPIDTFANTPTKEDEKEQVLELKIDLQELCRQRSPSVPVPCKVTTVASAPMSEKRRLRSPSDPSDNVQNRPTFYIPSPTLSRRHHEEELEVPEKIAEVDEESSLGQDSVINRSDLALNRSMLDEHYNSHAVTFLDPGNVRSNIRKSGSSDKTDSGIGRHSRSNSWEDEKNKRF